MTEQVLDDRALNRALLARQGLLERQDSAPLDMVERLVGLQAQVPANPYLALWSRLRLFDPEQLSALIADRAAVRTAVMRGTIHLLSARDALGIHPVTLPLLAQLFKSPFGKGLAGADPAEVTAAGVELMAAEPRTRSELGELLSPRWPDADPASLGWCVTYHAPSVQVPPRGLWGGRGQARLATVQQWLGRELEPRAEVDGLVLRYLAAFGPASVADARTWSRVTGLREVFERLRPGLRTFRDVRGRELFDVPGGALPDPATPAPPRFLPEYDNAGLSHDDRSRLFAGLGPSGGLPGGGTPGSLLVDGFYRAKWLLTERKGTARLEVLGFTAHAGDPAGTAAAIEAEANAMLGFLAPGAERRELVL